MKRTLMTLAAVAAVGLFTASTASAQCDFNGPGKAKGIKASLVRAAAPCGGVTFAAPNSATMAGTPTCAPPVLTSAYQFDTGKGKCDWKAGAKLEAPCKDGSGIDCHNLTIQVKCGGVLDPDGFTPTNSTGWTFRTLARTTLNDSVNGDMTVIDFPAQFTFPAAKKGKLSLKSDTNALLALLFGPGNALPACTALETLSVAVADPAGNRFAVVGAATRPK